MALSLAGRDTRGTFLLRFPAAIGLAHAAMLAAGGRLLLALAPAAGTVGRIVAASLLAVLGAKAIAAGVGAPGEPLAGGAAARPGGGAPRGLALLAVALLLSIDAFAAGIGVGVAGHPPVPVALRVGATAAVVCAAGLLAGVRARVALGRRATLAAGLLLLALAAAVFAGV